MSASHSGRAGLTKSQRIVIKIGSKALADDPELFAKLAADIYANQRRGRRFVVVSSGAIAFGLKSLGYKRRPKEIAKLQAAAATGQSALMRHWVDELSKYGLICAQVLLTHADLADRVRLNNARQALAALQDVSAIPIINENDTVATDEIRFGDNDQLATMVVPLVGADLLIMLTNVEGVLDDGGERISVMQPETRVSLLPGARDGLGTGGIESKVDAAHKAGRSGASTVVARASHPKILSEVLAGRDVGSFFAATGAVLKARKHWIAYTLRPKGAVLIDDGAMRAVVEQGRSLLPIGVVGVRGQFNPGDAVQLVTLDGREVARGLSRMSSGDVARSAGRARSAGEAASNGNGNQAVVHRDDLVVSLYPSA